MTERPKSPPEPASGKEALNEPIVFVIDDAASMREALRSPFQSVGLWVEVCSVRRLNF